MIVEVMCSGVLSPQEPTVCADIRTGITPPQYHTPSNGRQQRLNSTRSVSVSPPKHDLWVFGGYHTPWFITPPHLSHPQTHPVGVRTCYHTPWFIRAKRVSNLHLGLAI